MNVGTGIDDKSIGEESDLGDKPPRSHLIHLIGSWIFLSSR